MKTEKQLDRAADVGIHLLALWTPFAVGTVNAYLIEDDPLTLVDTGPNAATAMNELEDGLAALGHRVEEIGLIVLTHHHMDHIGLVEVVLQRSGAELAALSVARPYVEGFAEQTRADYAYVERVMIENGVPADLAAASRARGEGEIGWAASAPLSAPLSDPDELHLRDRVLRVDYRPGHSPTDTVVTDGAAGVVFTGDHLIAGASSNPLVTRPLGSELEYDGERPQAMLELRESLRATRGGEFALALPGHGPPFVDVIEEVDERLSAQERRAERTLKRFADGPLTAYEVARRTWGEIAISQNYLTICEILGHCDLLSSQGLLTCEREGDLLLFSAT